MKINWKILNLIVLGVSVLISGLGTFYAQLSFGAGIGDLFGYLILYLGTLTHLVLTLIYRKKSPFGQAIVTLFFLAFTILIMLFATIWRGSEYTWNGSIFYLPCPTKVKIDNQENQKEELIQMCSMQYYSEFTGIWDGQFMRIENEKIKVPKELEKYVKRPITIAEIEPEFHRRHGPEGTRKVFNFNKDTLQINKRYNLTGEIRAIRNKTPVIEVKIKQQHFQ